MNQGTKHDFQAVVWDYYRRHGRHDLPWRQPEANGNFDPYKILVSELMLQQTQVVRVVPKYQAFLAHFPSLEALAAASLGEVLRHWNGLGYNRRAKFLWQAAQLIQSDHRGQFPKHVKYLVKLPGVGPNTAGAVAAYAFNHPVVFIETNIRTAFIHHFFADEVAISDTALLPLIDQALDREHPREWYWALMDYGSHLKREIGNLNKLSIQYAKQSTFAGSRRQVRGQVIRLLTAGPHTKQSFRIEIADTRLDAVLNELLNEGLIREMDGKYVL